MALLLPFLFLLISSCQYSKYIPQSVLQLDIFSHLFRIVDTQRRLFSSLPTTDRTPRSRSFYTELSYSAAGQMLTLR